MRSMSWLARLFLTFFECPLNPLDVGLWRIDKRDESDFIWLSFERFSDVRVFYCVVAYCRLYYCPSIGLWILDYIWPRSRFWKGSTSTSLEVSLPFGLLLKLTKFSSPVNGVYNGCGFGETGIAVLVAPEKVLRWFTSMRTRIVCSCITTICSSSWSRFSTFYFCSC